MEQKTVSLVTAKAIGRSAIFTQMITNTSTEIEVIKMSSETTGAIRAYSHDENQSDSLLALMDWYGVTRLADISEEQGREFLDKLRRGEIRIYG